MRSFVHVFVAATLVCLAPSPSAGEEEEVDNVLFGEALEHYRNGDYRQALEVVVVLEKEEPDRLLYGEENLCNFKGSCLAALRYFQHARKEFEKALEAQPDSFDMKYNLAEMDFLQEHFAAAREKFAALKNSDRGRPYSEFLDFKIGMCLLMEGDKEGVAEEMKDRSRAAPLSIFLGAAVALRAKKPGKAEVLLLAGREKLDAESYALYEDSLIECGLIAPHTLLPAAAQEEFDTALRRPLSLGTGRLEPRPRPESADDPIGPIDPVELIEPADDPVDESPSKAEPEKNPANR